MGKRKRKEVVYQYEKYEKHNTSISIPSRTHCSSVYINETREVMFGFGYHYERKKEQSQKKKSLWSLLCCCGGSKNSNEEEEESKKKKILHSDLFGQSIERGNFKQYSSTYSSRDVIYQNNQDRKKLEPPLWHSLSMTYIHNRRILVCLGGISNSKEAQHHYRPSNQHLEVENTFSDIWIYDLQNKRWNIQYTYGVVPETARDHTAIYVPEIDSIVMFSGYTGFTYPNDIYFLSLSNFQWIRKPTKDNKAPFRRFGHSMVVYQHKTYLFGGCLCDGKYTLEQDLWTFNCIEGTWEQIFPIGNAPSKRFDHACIVIKNQMFVYGGKPYGKRLFHDLFVLSLDTLVWRSYAVSLPLNIPDQHIEYKSMIKVHLTPSYKKPLDDLVEKEEETKPLPPIDHPNKTSVISLLPSSEPHEENINQDNAEFTSLSALMQQDIIEHGDENHNLNTSFNASPFKKVPSLHGEDELEDLPTIFFVHPKTLKCQELVADIISFENYKPIY
mmetsp:Transcript_402/g.740  ORF Transcript_402/g.740 Transcript_402/m.740 type:complete len:499 (+) Transcript_402:14-1510(+)